MAKRKVTLIPDEEPVSPDPIEVLTPSETEEPAAAELPVVEPVVEVESAAAEPEPEPEPPAPKEKAKKEQPVQAQPIPTPRPAPGDVVQVRLVGAPQAVLLVADGRQITVLKGELHRARYAHYRLAWQANRTAWSVKYPDAAAFVVEAD